MFGFVTDVEELIAFEKASDTLIAVSSSNEEIRLSADSKPVTIDSDASPIAEEMDSPVEEKPRSR